MEINAAKEKIRIMEKAVYDVVNKFESETNVQVMHINILRTPKPPLTNYDVLSKYTNLWRVEIDAQL